MPIGQKMSRIGKLFSHLYVFLISINTSNLDILTQNHKRIKISMIFAHTKNFWWGRMTIFSYQAYMWISIEIKFQLTLVIFPKIVYNYSCTMIFHQVELKIKTITVYQQYRHETMIHRIKILAPRRADAM